MLYGSPRNPLIRDPNSIEVPKFGWINPFLAIKTQKNAGKKQVTVEERARRLYDMKLSKTCAGQWLFLVYNTGG